jgi:hypothetical protein
MMCLFSILYSGTFAFAGAPCRAVIHPELLCSLLNAAGLQAETLRSGDERGVSISSLHGRQLYIGFPESGLVRNQPFFLQIDQTGMYVELTDGADLLIVSHECGAYDAEDDVAYSGVLGMVACILDAVFDMVEGILANPLNVLGILNAVFEGVLEIMDCVL